MVRHHGPEDNTLGQTIGKPTALSPGANTDTKLLIDGLFQKGRVLAHDGGHIAILDNSAIVVDGRTLPGGSRSMNAATTAWAKKRYVEKQMRDFKEGIYKQEGLSSQERATAVQEFRREIEQTFDGFSRAKKYEIMLREAYGLEE